MKFFVWVTVPRGNGKHETLEDTVEGSEEDAREVMWDLLESLGVETAIEPIEEP